MRWLVALLFIFTFCSNVFAEKLPESDIPFRYNLKEVNFDVNKDGSFTETGRYEVTILKEASLDDFRQSSVSFSTTVAKGEILEAYTLKKSGKRIDAPKSSYQVTANNGYKNAPPLFSDETTISVVHPDLEVGDKVVFAYKIVNSEGIFPNQFSEVRGFSKFVAYDDGKITLTAPADMKFKHESYFLTEVPPYIKNGKQVFEWRYQNKQPEKWTEAEDGISRVGDDPLLFISTFNSYKEIADAYGVRALPKAAVTPRVKELAEKIVAGKTGEKEQAKAIYDWVSKNISYLGNNIGIGVVVPRDLNVILDNKLGDCKDHATLLQALYSAIGIKSEQALVNATDLYELPKTPVVNAVNHVINYIPDMKLYVDSTASDIPFGVLSPQLGEKPVLLVGDFHEGEKIPTTATYDNEEHIKTTIRVNLDGTAEGKVDVTMKGLPAVVFRALMRAITEDKEDLLVKALLEKRGFHGSGTIQKDDPTGLLDSYHFSVTFKLQDFLDLSGSIGMYVRPAISTVTPIDTYLTGAYHLPVKKPSFCIGGSVTEDYIYEFPKGVTILSVPKNYKLSDNNFDYSSDYKVSGNSIAVTRKLIDKTGTNICPPDVIESSKKDSKLILKDVKAQIFLRNDSEN
ncbi:MAG: DUF3857 and transglutaminase domain-containing protein [Desulfuromonadales bacterium]|nr:DUF3857 and transglutaminase domain-containing protein [Desulfuromonadales bacterium]